MLDVNLRLKKKVACRIASFFFRSSYAGYLEGNISSINLRILRKLPKEAAIMFWGKSAETVNVHIVPPCYSPNGRLPNYVCFALLCSSPVKGRPDSADSEWSECVCCWFSSDAHLPITDLVEQGVKPFDWAKVAVNCSC